MSAKKMAGQQASHEHTHVENTSGTAQRARLLERLQAGPIDTFTAIRELNIVRPGARINELRDMGHRIMTERLTLTDDQGRTHRGMALYYLSTNPPARVTA
ncbi:helix-turn-helix domain-containing protein [Pseudomonas chlororaphis]|uniref:helix-turn-helix domain-containing protein n=1 Tax=Pseudomonas chlororaphis TaxID=587753 RepID=UPI001B31166C|nr:helix-turn-helix domain-containing protein [Pseudomonas chlororaphis]QTT91438.1 helix-turn-helix domain-containing protein [Pseudomonas chlororaphis]